jgi:hypothetical protein
MSAPAEIADFAEVRVRKIQEPEAASVAISAAVTIRSVRLPTVCLIVAKDLAQTSEAHGGLLTMPSAYHIVFQHLHDLTWKNPGPSSTELEQKHRAHGPYACIVQHPMTCEQVIRIF